MHAGPAAAPARPAAPETAEDLFAERRAPSSDSSLFSSSDDEAEAEAAEELAAESYRTRGAPGKFRRAVRGV